MSAELKEGRELVKANVMRRVVSWLATRQDLALVAMLVATVLMLILPIPTWFADILIATNIGIALILMLTAVYVGSSVEFSTLPTVVLLTTAFRLSLSITTSRLVLTQGDAGEIIRAFGQFVIAGNVVVGLVVYFIVTIVQFVVITKGSERVAEVAARFTLDALPGKQISIDTDLRNGDIDAAEARRRRRLLERESQLYGALDGAMKFVKGDAIASLVIIVINLVGGIAIGCLQRGLSFGDAIDTYSLLAVGDGLIAQIPALLISLTVGVIVTRAASDQGGNLGQHILHQLAAEPRTLQIAAVVLAGLGFVPGFPTAVFLVLSGALGGAGWLLASRRRREAAKEFATAREAVGPEAVAIELSIGAGLSSQQAVIAAALAAQREELALDLGIPVPRIRIVEQAGQADLAWRIDFDGIPSARGQAELEDAPAMIVSQARRSVLRAADQLIGIQETQGLLSKLETGYGDLVREVAKVAPLPRLADILRRLVSEEVSIRHMRQVLEAVAEWAPKEANLIQLVEQVRFALRRQISHRWADDMHTLHVLVVEGGIEDALRAASGRANDRHDVEQTTVELIKVAARRHESGGGFAPVIIVSGDLRRSLRTTLVKHDIMLPVMSHNEIAPESVVVVIDTIRQAVPVDLRGEVTPLRPAMVAPNAAAA